MMISQTQQNDITRRLAAWAAILAVPTAVAGIYGMNFEFMPELKTHWGYPVTLAGIAAACGVLFWRFRKSGLLYWGGQVTGDRTSTRLNSSHLCAARMPHPA